MENCVIYSHYLDFDKVINAVKNVLPKAQYDIQDNGLQKSLTATIKGGFFSKGTQLKINYRQRERPSYQLLQAECPLTQNLIGMANFVKSFPAQNTKIQGLLIHKITTLNCEMAFMVEPAFNGQQLSLLKNILTILDGIAFASPGKNFPLSTTQHFLDKNLNLILDASGQSSMNDLSVEIESKYFDKPQINAKEDQIQRKQSSIAFLNSKGIHTIDHLPFRESEEDVVLRSKQEIIDRVYALTLYAAYGEGVPKPNLMKVVEDKKVNSFTSFEQSVLNKEELTDQDKANCTWRYESLQVLLWALGKVEPLIYPSAICNVKEMVASIIPVSRAEFENSCQLKSKKEILDELDKTYRMNWACVNARVTGKEVGGNISSSIIYERHYALNWLVKYMNQEWDNVTTET